MNNLTIKVGITDGKLDPCLLNSETKREWLDRLKTLFGIDPDDLALSILIVLTRACSKPEAVTINAMLAQIIAGQPRDVQETILLAQMASTAQRI
jgi:hypothetical protein